MAELQASWIQASSHPADTDRLVLEGLMNPAGAPVSGAAYGVGQAVNDLKVQAKGTPNMSVDVLSGHGWVDGTEGANQGAYHVYNDATKNVVVAASDPTNPRKDLVVAKVQDAAYSGATNAWSIAVVTGTPAASPAEPAVPVNAIVLALVDVAALATTVVNGNITDRRRRASGLGGVAVCTSATRPAAPYAGQVIFETDTNFLKVWSGSAWEDIVATGAGTNWTPTVTQSGSVTVTVNRAKYTKAGRWVTLKMNLTVTGAGVAGNAVSIGGLPFTAAAADNGPIGTGLIFDSSAADDIAGFAFLTSTTLIQFLGCRSAGNILGIGAGFAAALASPDQIRMTCTYEAAT